MARQVALLLSAVAIGLVFAGPNFTQPGNYTPSALNSTTPGGFVFNVSTPGIPFLNSSTPSNNNGTGWNFTTPSTFNNDSTPFFNKTSPPWSFNNTTPASVNGTNNTNPWFNNGTTPIGNFTWPPLNQTTTAFPYYNYSTTPSPSNGSFCPAGWILSNSTSRTCYYVAFLASYTAATQFCSVLQPGATVLTIESAFENTEIRELGSTSSFWLGLDRFRGSWQWANGANATYMHWFSGEPAADANCARANRRDGFWYGADCAVDQPVVCKLKF